MNHIMLDLETLSAKKDAFIVALGAVRFDLEKLEVAKSRSESEFYRIISVEEGDQDKYKLRIDYDTVKWWMQQSQDARNIFRLPSTWLVEALADFSRFVKQTNPDRTYIWGNGATFDNVILRNTFESCGMTYPVIYKNDMCYRTVRRTFDYLGIPDESTGTAHNALDDARNQALKLVKIFKAVKLNQQETK